ncbi:hypothetical protein [Pseudoalteromonas rubra]|nr:hypothetical protein [Pseudoalteromonas rubra]
MKFLVCMIGGLLLISAEAWPHSFVGKLTVGAPRHQYHFATSSGKALDHLVALDQIVSKGEPLLRYQEVGTTKEGVRLILAGSQGVVTELNSSAWVAKGELLAKLLTPKLLGIFEPEHDAAVTARALWFCHAGSGFEVRVSYESSGKMFVTLHLNEYVIEVSELFKVEKSTTLYTSPAQCRKQRDASLGAGK